MASRLPYRFWLPFWAFAFSFLSPHQVISQVIIDTPSYSWCEVPVFFPFGGNSDSSCASYFSGRSVPFEGQNIPTGGNGLFSFNRQGGVSPCRDGSPDIGGDTIHDILVGGWSWFSGASVENPSVLATRPACFMDSSSWLTNGLGYVSSSGFVDRYILISTQVVSSASFQFSWDGYLWSEGVPVYSEFGQFTGDAGFDCIVVNETPIFILGDSVYGPCLWTSMDPWHRLYEVDGATVASVGNHLLLDVAVGAGNVLSISSDFDVFAKNALKNWLFSDILSAPSVNSSLSKDTNQFFTGYFDGGISDYASGMFLTNATAVSGYDGLSSYFVGHITIPFLGLDYEYEYSDDPSVPFYRWDDRPKRFLSFQDKEILPRPSYVAATNAIAFTETIQGTMTRKIWAHVRCKPVTVLARENNRYGYDALAGFNHAWIGYVVGQLSGGFMTYDFHSYRTVLQRISKTVRNHMVFRFPSNPATPPPFFSSSGSPRFNSESPPRSVPSFLR